LHLRTTDFELTIGEYLRLHIAQVLQKRIWIFACLAALAGYLWWSVGPHPMSIVVTVAVPLYVLALAAYVWRFAAHRDNSLFYARRTIEFTDEFIVGRLEDGSESKIRYDHVKRAVESRKFLELRISKSQAIIIPKRAFVAEDDLDEVRCLLHEKHLL
jgi:hypothetical protein